MYGIKQGQFIISESGEQINHYGSFDGVEDGSRVEYEFGKKYIEPDESIHCNRGSDVIVAMPVKSTPRLYTEQELIQAVSDGWDAGELYGYANGIDCIELLNRKPKEQYFKEEFNHNI